jgi:hypothetical protein
MAVGAQLLEGGALRGVELEQVGDALGAALEERAGAAVAEAAARSEAGPAGGGEHGRGEQQGNDGGTESAHVELPLVSAAARA